MSSQGIEWLDEEAILDAVLLLQEQYAKDPIGIINLNPIGYVTNLAAVSHYYDSDPLSLAQGMAEQNGTPLGGMLVSLIRKLSGSCPLRARTPRRRSAGSLKIQGRQHLN